MRACVLVCWEGGGCQVMKGGDVHSSPGTPVLVFAWHFHA